MHEPMVSGGVVLGKGSSEVVSSSSPVDNELTLVDPVSDPIKSHVNGLGTSLLDGVIGNASSTGILLPCSQGYTGGGC